METVGKLDQDHANVVDHREEHLAQALRLVFLFPRGHCPAIGDVPGPGDLTELGDAVDQVRDPAPERRADLLLGDIGVLHRIVKQSGRKGFAIDLHPGEDDCDLDRMDHVRLARLADDHRGGPQ